MPRFIAGRPAVVGRARRGLRPLRAIVPSMVSDVSVMPRAVVIISPVEPFLRLMAKLAALCAVLSRLAPLCLSRPDEAPPLA